MAWSRALRRLAPIVCLALPAAVTGCGAAPHGAASAPLAAATTAGTIRFRDVTAEWGLPPVRDTSVAPEELNILRMSPGGCGFLDYDGDGDLDVLLVGPERCALYENDGRARFREATARAGLTAPGAYMGCATGDWDNDGRVDLFLCGYRIARLYRNLGGRFAEVTSKTQIASDRWFSSAAFADVDRDGDLDLYVGAYVRYDRSLRQHCPIGIDPQGRVVEGACGPEPYAPEVGSLYLNQGGGRFIDVTLRSGLHRATGKTLGVAFGDYDGDGDPDLYLANDRMAGDLFENQGTAAGCPRFRNVGVDSGTAYNREGNAQSGMGVDWGDFDNDGRLDLFVGTFQGEPKSAYRNLGGGLFQEVSRPAGLAPAWPYVTFGTCLLDADNDGWLDLFLANGHVLGPVERVDPAMAMAQPMRLFRNRGNGSFEDLSRAAGFGLAPRLIGRGAAAGDVDSDGRCDLLAVDLRGRACLLRNESRTGHHWLRVRLVGRRSNRDGIGARATLVAGRLRQVREATTGGSYLAARDPRLLFGLGDWSGPVKLVVRWPAGGVSRLTIRQVDREIEVREGPPGSSAG